jgi:hypothetical protein
MTGAHNHRPDVLLTFGIAPWPNSLGPLCLSAWQMGSPKFLRRLRRPCDGPLPSKGAGAPRRVSDFTFLSPLTWVSNLMSSCRICLARRLRPEGLNNLGLTRAHFKGPTTIISSSPDSKDADLHSHSHKIFRA